MVLTGWGANSLWILPAGKHRIFEVIMLEPGTGEALEVPVAFSEFHTQGLEDFFDACLAPDFFAEWMATGRRDVQFSECIGYKVPLFLGGEDCVLNLESSDIEIYWSLMGDLRLATRHLAPGASVSGMDIHG
ncbi:T6SS immunity protein Tdi1 domain-containing protein [Arthrobacter sp. UC242_113]|uniref:T6SS immunity protein Tdi1 domain-containing protein n=1 Tax=Arthrobacter sp. UC242_113 TaxID=3374550 RepID=UPI0037583145